MIKAALSDKNKKDINSSINGKAGTYTKNESIYDSRPLHKNVLNSRKRPPKNSVIFTEPLVTKEYEYEQTIVESPAIPQKHLMFDQRRASIDGHHLRNKFFLVSRSNHYTNHISGSPKMRPKLKSFNSLVDAESEDDLITIQTSESDLRKVLPSSRQSLQSVKRSRESSHDNTETQDRSRTLDDNGSKIMGKTESVSGGLFSAPKVAKIMPYYDDLSDRKEENVCNDSGRRDRRVRIRNISNRANLASRSGASSISEEDANNVDSNNNLNNKPSYPDPAEMKSNASQLISFRKIGAGDDLSPNSDDHLESIPTKPDDRMFSYFGWFTGFLSDRMSKLIF